MFDDKLTPAVRLVLGDDLERHLGRPVKPAELVAVGIAQIGEVELAILALTEARRFLDGRAARFDTMNTDPLRR